VMWEKPGAHSGSLIESLRSDDRIQDFYGRPLRHHDCPLLAEAGPTQTSNRSVFIADMRNTWTDASPP